MSVLIKGAEMPENCDVCFLADTNICWRTCPLVEVPTPHGRLIDADIVTDVIANMMPSWTTPDGTGQYDHEIMTVQEAFVDSMQAINEQTTVIDAED